MGGTKPDTGRPGRATGLKKQKSIKSPKAPPKEVNNAPRLSFGKKPPKPDASPGNKGLKKNQSLSRSKAASPKATRPTSSARSTSSKATRPTKNPSGTTAKSPKASRPTNVQSRPPAKSRAAAKLTPKPKPTIKTARGNPFGSDDASSSSSSVESSYAGGVVPLPSPTRTSSKKVPQEATNMASPRTTSRSRHVKHSTEISPTNNTENKTTEYEASNLSITSSNLGVVPITPSPKPAEKVAEKKKKKTKKSKSVANEKKGSPNSKPPRAKVEEEDDKSEQSEKSIAQSITESILPFLVKKTKKPKQKDSGTRDDAAAGANKLDKKMQLKEEQKGRMNNDEEASIHDGNGDTTKEIENSNSKSPKKETDIPDNQDEHHHHRRAHAAFRGAPSTDESQLLPDRNSKVEINANLLDNIKRIETPSNAATLHKVMTALQTERENAFDAKCQLREALAELDKVKGDFRDAKESYNNENYRLNNKLTRMMDRIEQLEHEMAMSGKNFVYATFEGEPEYKSAASPSTRYGARSPRAVRLSKIPWACVDAGAFSFMNPCSGGGEAEEQRDTFPEPTNSLIPEEETEDITEEETEGEDYFSRPSSEIVPRE